MIIANRILDLEWKGLDSDSHSSMIALAEISAKPTVQGCVRVHFAMSPLTIFYIYYILGQFSSSLRRNSFCKSTMVHPCPLYSYTAIFEGKDKEKGIFLLFVCMVLQNCSLFLDWSLWLASNTSSRGSAPRIEINSLWNTFTHSKTMFASSCNVPLGNGFCCSVKSFNFQDIRKLCKIVIQ